MKIVDVFIYEIPIVFHYCKGILSSFDNVAIVSCDIEIRSMFFIVNYGIAVRGKRSPWRKLLPGRRR